MCYPVLLPKKRISVHPGCGTVPHLRLIKSKVLNVHHIVLSKFKATMCSEKGRSGIVSRNWVLLEAKKHLREGVR